jgi:copper(I)-binding protein
MVWSSALFVAMVAVMLKRSGHMLLGGLLICGLGMVHAQSAADRVVVSGAYVRAVPPGQPNSVAFMVLHNGDKRAHALVAAESRDAKIVELHAHRMVDDMMQMRPVERIELPAGTTTSLKPGGLHVMLIGLLQPLVVGRPVPLTLVFEDGSRKNLTVPVHRLRMHLPQDQMDHGKHQGEGKLAPQKQSGP